MAGFFIAQAQREILQAVTTAACPSRLRANEPDTFKSMRSGGLQSLGQQAVEERILD